MPSNILECFIFGDIDCLESFSCFLNMEHMEIKELVSFFKTFCG